MDSWRLISVQWLLGNRGMGWWSVLGCPLEYFSYGGADRSEKNAPLALHTKHHRSEELGFANYRMASLQPRGPRDDSLTQG